MHIQFIRPLSSLLISVLI